MYPMTSGEVASPAVHSVTSNWRYKIHTTNRPALSMDFIDIVHVLQLHCKEILSWFLTNNCLHRSIEQVNIYGLCENIMYSVSSPSVTSPLVNQTPFPWQHTVGRYTSFPAQTLLTTTVCECVSTEAAGQNDVCDIYIRRCESLDVQIFMWINKSLLQHSQPCTSCYLYIVCTTLYMYN